MSETPVQYIDRLLRTLGSQQPLDVLAQTPALLRDWMEEHDTREWKKAQSSGEWSPAQVLAHLAEGELVFSYRLRMIARTSGIQIQAFDQDLWVNHSTYLTKEPQLALKLFESLRQANLAYIRSLPESDFENFGIHSERGKETVQRLFTLCAGHDLNHLKQIEERLR